MSNAFATEPTKPHLHVIEGRKGQKISTNTSEMTYNKSEDIFYLYNSELMNKIDDILAYSKQNLHNYIDERLCDLSNLKVEGGDNMDWQEKYIDKLDKDVDDIKSEIKNIESKIDYRLDKAVSEMREIVNQTLAELRDRDNQRHLEIIELQKKIDNNIDSINNQFKEDRKWIIGLVITTIIGIAAMVITVILTR